MAPLPRCEPGEGTILGDWRRAESELCAPLARVAQRLGALDDRMFRVPKGWQRRLALSEAADLAWFAGFWIPPDRLALWLALRTGSTDAEDVGMATLGWAVRRLSDGPAPASGLAAFLGRHETAIEGNVPLGDRLEGWKGFFDLATDLHPITRAALGFYIWPMAGIGPEDERLEAAVLAARVAAQDCRGGLIFVPLAAGGGGGLRAGGDPVKRLRAWLDGMETAIRAAQRMLDALEDWQKKSAAATADLSGRTPERLVAALVEWPMLSAPMAEEITGASRAAVQRNLALLEHRGLVREVTGQGRFRFWRADL